MPLLDPPAFRDALPPTGAVLGLDIGTKTIGVAVTDPRRTIASPLDTLVRKKFTKDAEALFALIDDRQAVGLVLGWPLNMDGSQGPRCQATKAFAHNVMRLRDLPIALWDERLSTAVVERALIAADTTRKRRAEVVDKMAAGYILQGFLDAGSA